MKIQIADRRQIRKLINAYMPHGFTRGLLFSGDRIASCDEAVVAFTDEDDFVGLASIAPFGEMHEGEPTIVGLWVRPEHRGQSRGVAILEAAVNRCLQRGLQPPILIDVVSVQGLRTVQKMAEDLQQYIQILDATGDGSRVL